jgi:hypothetical protein
VAEQGPWSLNNLEKTDETRRRPPTCIEKTDDLSFGRSTDIERDDDPPLVVV